MGQPLGDGGFDRFLTLVVRLLNGDVQGATGRSDLPDVRPGKAPIMTILITTLKSIAAATTLGIVVACGAAPESEVSSVDPGATESETTSSTDAADDPVPWAQLPDGDRIERTRATPMTGCITVDTMLPC